MEFTNNHDDADEVLNLVGVLWVVLEDNGVAVQCAEAIEAYAKSFPIGNNQIAAVCFFDTGPQFGAVDLWNKDNEEEVQ